ncbi:hypothetical protein R3P38DRAFT_3212272 [Favolaschia claudopus]|uniref:Uncharacterized protein n=1 Tax=Favolaschia claudopus TaxID=2862362 RepID=A0AAW0ADK9_9AGAR
MPVKKATTEPTRRSTRNTVTTVAKRKRVTKARVGPGRDSVVLPKDVEPDTPEPEDPASPSQTPSPPPRPKPKALPTAHIAPGRYHHANGLPAPPVTPVPSFVPARSAARSFLARSFAPLPAPPLVRAPATHLFDLCACSLAPPANRSHRATRSFATPLARLPPTHWFATHTFASSLPAAFPLARSPRLPPRQLLDSRLTISTTVKRDRHIRSERPLVSLYPPARSFAHTTPRSPTPHSPSYHQTGSSLTRTPTHLFPSAMLRWCWLVRPSTPPRSFVPPARRRRARYHQTTSIHTLTPPFRRPIHPPLHARSFSPTPTPSPPPPLAPLTYMPTTHERMPHLTHTRTCASRRRTPTPASASALAAAAATAAPAPRNVRITARSAHGGRANSRPHLRTRPRCQICAPRPVIIHLRPRVTIRTCALRGRRTRSLPPYSAFAYANPSPHSHSTPFALTIAHLHPPPYPPPHCRTHPNPNHHHSRTYIPLPRSPAHRTTAPVPIVAPRNKPNLHPRTPPPYSYPDPTSARPSVPPTLPHFRTSAPTCPSSMPAFACPAALTAYL